MPEFLPPETPVEESSELAVINNRFVPNAVISSSTCFFIPSPNETSTITEVTPTITPNAVRPLLSGVEIIDLKAKFIASKIFKNYSSIIIPSFISIILSALRATESS